ncbi:MAG: hypothetical protein K6A96_11050 [Prevotella sp.]|nr:hypothetical protein [Prevotella sp.]
METTKKEKAAEEVAMASQQTQQGGQESVLSARDRHRQRYRESYPDMGDDDEAYYAQANANLDELEGFRESNRQLGEAMDAAPLLAGLVLAAKEGENPFVYLAENIGPDMDVRELASDPDFGKKMGDALTKYQKKMAKSEATRQEIGNNFQQTLTVLKDLAAERGMSDEERDALYKKMYGETDADGNVVDYGIFGNASMGIVPKEVWEAVLKADSYDSDMATATEKARAQALNEKSQNPLKKFDNMPPSLNGGGRGRTAEPRRRGGFADWGTDEA